MMNEITQEVMKMFNLKEFNGTLISEPYMVNSFDELQRQVLKEIVFYGSGLGWRQCSNEVEEHYILFPYAEKEREEPEEYIKKLKFLVDAEIRYYRNCVTGTFNAIKDFSWSLEVTNNKDFFVLILRKM